MFTLNDYIKEEPEEDEEQSTNGALLNLNVRFSSGHYKTISIYDNDIIEEKVELFCKKHSLNNDLKNVLTTQVMNRLDMHIIELEQKQKEKETYNDDKDNKENNTSKYKPQSPEITTAAHSSFDDDIVLPIQPTVSEICYTKPKQQSENKNKFTKKNTLYNPKEISKSIEKNKEKKESNKKKKEKDVSIPLKKIIIPMNKQSNKNSNKRKNDSIFKGKEKIPARTLNSPPPNLKSFRNITILSPQKSNKILSKSTSSQELHKSNSKDKENTINVNQSKINTSKRVYSEKSLEIMRIKILKYDELFTILDSDRDGLISSKNIGICYLNKELLCALTSLLEELQITQKQMTFKEFCIKIDKISAVKEYINIYKKVNDNH